MKAHQRIIREKRAAEELDKDLFGNYWEKSPIDIKEAVIKEISGATAKSIIEKYEWLGTMPAVYRFCFGIYFSGNLGGVCVYGDEYAENLGVWDAYGYTGKMIALLRGACVHWAHPHAASKLTRTSMKMLPKKYEVVTCTVDRTAGEIGTIYQACGFDYVGQMSKGGDRASIKNKDGISTSARQAGRKHGTRGYVALRSMGIECENVPRKERYFAFIGSKKAILTNRAAISHLLKPYPKRVVEPTPADSVKASRSGAAS